MDPYVGVRVQYPIAERWTLVGYADVGGFGVGSEFTWQAAAGINYEFSKSIAGKFGYRYHVRRLRQGRVPLRHGEQRPVPRRGHPLLGRRAPQRPRVSESSSRRGQRPNGRVVQLKRMASMRTSSVTRIEIQAECSTSTPYL